jgi:membrane associated rhomboid family serine protease
MLEDRDYMRQPEYHDSGWHPSFRLRWSWTAVLLVVYAAVFLGELIIWKYFPAQADLKNPDSIFGLFALSQEGLGHGYVWQLVTYQFMHVGLLHIFFNSWAIYMFGREVEAILGGPKFLALMFSSGMVGGVFQIIVALVWPQYFGGSVMGASACGFGLVAAFAMLFPERELTLLILFVIPVHMRAKTLLIGSAVLAVTGFAFPNIIMPGVAHAAHLGGMVMGWFFVRKILQGDWSRLIGALRPAEKKLPRRPLPEPLGEKPADADFVASEVDPILDKISAHGLQSLTPREREILETARKHIKRS